MEVKEDCKVAKELQRCGKTIHEYHCERKVEDVVTIGTGITSQTRKLLV